MQELLIIKLHDYLAVHYPDLLLTLEEEGQKEVFIQEKVAGISGELDVMLAGDTPAYMVEVHCMDVLIVSLGPSKYDYIYNILEEEFEERVKLLEAQGILLYEIINIIQSCGTSLDAFDEDDRMLRCEIIGTVADYFVHPETISHGV